MIDAVKLIADAGANAGFGATEVFGERVTLEQYDYFPGFKTRIHGASTHRVTARAFWDVGEPVGFRLSSPGEKDIKAAMAAIYSGGAPSPGENFGRRLPTAYKKLEQADLAIYDHNFQKIDIQRFQELVDQVHEILLTSMFKNLRLRRIHFFKTLRKIYIANSRGLNAKYIKTHFHFLLSLGLGQNSVDVSENSTFFDAIDPYKMAPWAYSLVNALSDRPLEAKRRNVFLLLAPEAAAFILREFSHFFHEKTDKRLKEIDFPAMLNLADDPLLNGQPGSVPFDDEGVQSTEKHIIWKGAFQGGVTDIGSGFPLGLKSTGNGFRGERSIFPSVRFSNLYIKPTVLSVRNLMEDAGEGIMASLLKLKYADREGYLFSAYGYRFSGANLLEPVHIHFRTNFLSYFLNICKISKELKFFHSRANFGSPYILLELKRKTPDMWEI